jgi:prepilin-type processing-associated H-X9-DG protein
MRRAAYQPLPDSNTGAGWGEERFGSSHPGGFNVVLADGSVRLISYSIPVATFRALSTVRGGEVLTNF